ELYVAVKAGTEGFNIVKVAGSVQTVYGPGADFAEVTQGTTDEPKVAFQRGSYSAASKAPFTVPADGLYHVVIDTELSKVVIVPVAYWGMIGAATPGGWSTDSKLEPEGFDLNTMTFKVEGLEMTKADWKFRYSGGWKVEVDTVLDLGGGVVGVKANTNFGEAVDNLIPGGANISNTVTGIYTVTMVWKLGQKYTATLTKTGDLQLVDYTNTQLGLVGDGLMVNGVQHNWDVTVMLHVPVVENETNYTWTYDGVEITTAGSFKIREGQDWSKKSIGYNDVTMAGLAADKFGTNGDGNFVPLEDGVFDMELFIDAVTETYTFTVNPAGQAPELYILGDGTPVGWDNTAAEPMTGTNGEYTITLDLPGGGYIKFLEVLGQWAPQYGTDANGTSTGGNLVYRPTENDPDPPAIPGPAAAGTYIITANTNTLTYTITLQ
ncbi:MAG: SusF/SusE family outer membrane protein, partial [Bacteroidales bacterium]|nr:SusF/SusE family outer membrane protein [Bacteroidales bacterium]